MVETTGITYRRSVRGERSDLFRQVEELGLSDWDVVGVSCMIILPDCSAIFLIKKMGIFGGMVVANQ